MPRDNRSQRSSRSSAKDLASASITSNSSSVNSSRLSMGRRKKNTQNVVKVDLGDFIFSKTEQLPVLVQHLSKDGRRIGRTVHQIPGLQPDPPPLAFDPRPLVAEDEDAMFLDTEPPGGGNGRDRVRSRSSPLFGFPDQHICCSWIHCGYGSQNAMLGFKN